MHSLAEMWHRIQSDLFPYLEETLADPLTEKLRQLSAILEIVRVEERVPRHHRRTGRPPCDRRAIVRSFVVKAVYDIPTTEGLVEMLRTQPSLRRICGFESRKDVPSESTFSRVFKEIADTGLCDATHELLVRTHIAEKIVCHVSRDSTAVSAREKPVRKEKVPPKQKYRRGRPKKGEHREPAAPRRLLQQMHQSAEEALSLLPTACGVGTKKNAKGHDEHWIGYKAHIDTVDFGLPVQVVTTSASLHDSQVAIPMARRTAERVTVLYELMDAAYDAKPIYEVCQSLSHRPIIEANRRLGDPIPFDPATAERYKERTTAERANGRLKDEFGLRHVRVRGNAKVHAHIMFGILALFADQLLKMVVSCRC